VPRCSEGNAVPNPWPRTSEHRRPSFCLPPTHWATSAWIPETFCRRQAATKICVNILSKADVFSWCRDKMFTAKRRHLVYAFLFGNLKKNNDEWPAKTGFNYKKTTRRHSCIPTQTVNGNTRIWANTRH